MMPRSLNFRVCISITLQIINASFIETMPRIIYVKHLQAVSMQININTINAH